MNLPIKIAVSILMLCIGTFALVSYDNVTMQISKAKDYEAEAINKIQDSHFDENVIESCKIEATLQGYELTVKNDGLYHNKEIYRVTLTYNLSINLLGINTKQVLDGYAL